MVLVGCMYNCPAKNCDTPDCRRRTVGNSGSQNRNCNRLVCRACRSQRTTDDCIGRCGCGTTLGCLKRDYRCNCWGTNVKSCWPTLIHVTRSITTLTCYWVLCVTLSSERAPCFLDPGQFFLTLLTTCFPPPLEGQTVVNSKIKK